MTPQELVAKLAANPSESSQQQALFAWSALPEVREKYPQLRWMFAIPNGGLRFNPGKFKAEGVKSGVPDIFLAVITGVFGTGVFGKDWEYCGLFIEMKKANKSVVSDKQNEWIDYLNHQGYKVVVCYGYEEAKRVLIEYLK